MSNALAIRHTAEDSQARVNAASNAQVKRYWPGRAPDWYDDERGPEAASSGSDDEEREPEPEEEPAATSVAAPVIVKKASTDKCSQFTTCRLSRLADLLLPC